MEACQCPYQKTADEETHEGGCVHVHDPSFQWAKIARNTVPLWYAQGRQDAWEDATQTWCRSFISKLASKDM